MLARVDAVDADIAALDTEIYGHLAPFADAAARLAQIPGVNSSAGKTRGNGSSGHGNRYLARALGEAAVNAGRTNTFPGARYRRLARRRGNNKALVAVGRSILIVVWHLPNDPQAQFHDLGADHYDRHLNTGAKRRNHVRQLEALGYHVTLDPVA
jgi:transposase